MQIGIDALSVVPHETGGGETYLRELLAELGPAAARRGHAVHVYGSTNNLTLFDGAADLTCVPVMADNRRRSRRLLFEHFRLGPRLARDGIDVLFAPGNALPLRLRCPAVLGVQSLHSFVVPQEMSRFRVLYFRRIVPGSARRAERVLCVSEDIRRLLLEAVPGLDAGKVRVVYEGAPEDLVRVTDRARIAEVCGRLGVTPDAFVLFVSSLNPFKRPEAAVRAVGHLRDAHDEHWPLLLAGRASPEHTERVRAAARAIGADDLVRIVGTVGREDLEVLYSAARAMIYPSTVETFGLPPLEAMACGCPVVASNRSCIPEITGDAALLVDPDDEAQVAASLHRVLHDDNLRDALVARGLTRIRRFRWDVAAEQTLDLLEEAAACSRTP